MKHCCCLIGLLYSYTVIQFVFEGMLFSDNLYIYLYINKLYNNIKKWVSHFFNCITV